MIHLTRRGFAGGALAASFVGGRSSAQGKTLLKFWTFLATQGTDPRSAALRGIVESFNAAQNRWEVQVESINFARIDNQVIQATASGQGPDILNVYSDLLAMHVAAKTVQPLDAYLAKLPSDSLSNLDFFKFAGRQMAVPWETRVWLLGYRRDLLEKAGRPVPATLEELAETAKAMSGEQTMGFGIGLSTGALSAHVIETFTPIFWSAGGRLFDDGGAATVNSEAGVMTLTFLRDLVTRHGAMRRTAVSMSVDEALNAVRAGTIAMTILGSYRVAAVRNSEATGEKLRTGPIPGFSAGKPSPARLAAQTLTMGANSKHPDGVMAFIQHYLAVPSQVAFAKAGVLPSRAASYADPAIASGPQAEEFKMWADYVRENGRFEPTPADFVKLAEELAKALQRTIIESADPKRALDDAVKTYNAQRR